MQKDNVVDVSVLVLLGEGVVLAWAAEFFVLDFLVQKEGGFVEAWEDGVLNNGKAGVGEEIDVGALADQIFNDFLFVFFDCGD